jgi:molybdopterin molybdotransferase
VFVRPALLALQGAKTPGPVYSAGTLAKRLLRNAQRDEFVRARLEPCASGVVLEPIAGQESHMIARAATAAALVLAPRGEGELAAGETVRYLPLA